MSGNVTRAATPDPRRAIPGEAVESRWTAPDGTRIRRIDWAPPAGPAPRPGAGARGALLFLPGRGDCYEKYLETLAHWHGEGWAVSSIDWRGQAGSGRLGRDERIGHVEDFAPWIADLADFWRDFAIGTPGPHVLVAHSMGGHLALRALAEGVVDPAALVLTAPMLGLHGLGLPTRVLHRIARLMAGLGDARRQAWATSEKPGSSAARRINLLTHDVARYADEQWWHEARPELAMGPASWGWVAGALESISRLEQPGVLERIGTPIQILATSADRLVSWGAIRRAAARLPRCELVPFGREARHELLREADPVRDACLAAISSFLDRVAPAGPQAPLAGQAETAGVTHP